MTILTIYIIGIIVMIVAIYTCSFITDFEFLDMPPEEPMFWFLPIIMGMMWFVVIPILVCIGIGWLLSKLFKNIGANENNQTKNTL